MSNKERMLGTEAHRHRGKNFWFCCFGHDGWNRKLRVVKKRIERRRSNRSVRNEEEE